MVQQMLHILLEEIGECKKWLTYADDCEDKSWIVKNAKNRIYQLVDDYDYVIKKIGLSESEEPIANSLYNYLRFQIGDLVDKVNRM